MDSKILLGKILQRFFDAKTINVEGYKSYGYIKETDNAVFVTRENGNETRIPFKKILIGIDAIKDNKKLYNDGPKALREFGLTHITSPLWSLLHLLAQKEYE